MSYYQIPVENRTQCRINDAVLPTPDMLQLLYDTIRIVAQRPLGTITQYRAEINNGLCARLRGCGDAGISGGDSRGGAGLIL